MTTDLVTKEGLNRDGDRRGMNPQSQANLRPNRNGRLPAKVSLTSLTKREIARVPTIEEDGFDGKGKPNAYWIVRRAVRDARNSDRYARTEIWERTEGKVPGDQPPPLNDNRVINFIISGEKCGEMIDGIAKRLTDATE